MFRYQAHLAVLAVVCIAGCNSAPSPLDTQQTGATLATSAAATVAADLVYDAFDAPSELGAFTSVFGINSAGTIAGNYFNVDGTVHGFLSSHGIFTDVAIPGAAGFFSASLGPVNDLGDAAGFYSDASDVAHLFVRARDGTISFLPDAVPDAIATDQTGMNNHGTIVGTYLDSGGHGHGFINRAGSYEFYDYPGATSTRLNGVNDAEVIVGQWSAAGIVHGFILANGQTTPVAFPGAVSTRAAAINNKEAIVGFYNNSDGVFHGFILDKGQYSTVDFPGSSDCGAFGINDRGVVVGTYNDFSFGFVASPSHGPGHVTTEILAGD